MELTRVIHPVGQGGFYSETFKHGSNEINVIYDCGGNNKASMIYYLDNYYPNKTKTIDAIFISHLHDDHINGLEHLLEKYCVKYLFLPQLTLDEQLELLLYNGLRKPTNTSGVNNFLYELLTSQGNYRNTRIVRVEHSNGDDQVSDEMVEDNNLDISKGIRITSIKSGTSLHLWGKWLLIPYNPPIKTEKGQGFYEYFKNKLSLGVFDNADIPNIVKEKGIKECKKVYEDYFGNNHNAYSMALFSGIAKPHRFFDYCDECFHDMLTHRHNCHHLRNLYRNKCPNSCVPNCLYTGDFDVNNHFKEMQLFYSSFWETIGSIQVPHHGSRNNYCPELYKYANIGFISVGERNRYHHPNVDTLIGIQGMDCNLVMVTESHSSMRMYHYYV